MENRVKVFNSINEVVEQFGKPQLSVKELRERGIDHILVKGQGYTKFSLILDKMPMLELINGKVNQLISEKIPGIKGIYGYSGVSQVLMNDYKRMAELGKEKKFYTVVVEYEGEYWSVNSGIYTGMILIHDTMEKVKFKTISD